MNHRGQAALESALALPLMILFVLGILQLTTLQQAKIMTEYAAFNAARAGTVWSGSNERMLDAAAVSILPTMGRTDDAGTLAATWVRYRSLDRAFRDLPWNVPVPRTVQGAALWGLVRVDTLAPADTASLGAIWNLRGGSDWKELDFDGPDTYPEGPGLERHFENFFNPAALGEGQDVYRRANVLTVRVRYWYELRIPIANGILFAAWYAANAAVAERRGRDAGYATLYPSEKSVLWSLASGHGGLGTRRFFVPLTATHSMRMQSNFHRKWIMHGRSNL